MAPDRRLPAPRRAPPWVGAVLLAATALAWAQPAKTGGPAIYRCEVNGKRITMDRPIPECADREQQVLGPDGSVRKVIPPTMTADERADAEARERTAQADRAAKQDAIRRDRNLVARFPNEAAHAKQREAALDDMRKAVRASELRVKELEVERKKLDDEAEFYPNRAMPQKLRSAMDANDAALAAQRALIQNQKDEMVRINANYDAELQHLRRLWAGAPAGSMGSASGPNSGSAAGKPVVAGKALEAAAAKPRTP